MSILFKIPDKMVEPDLPIDLRVAIVSNYGQPQTEFLTECIREYRESRIYKDMKVGKNYFFNQNDICQRQKYYINRQGEPVMSEILTNSKLSHPFMRKLVNQKINYLLSKEFTIQGDDNYVQLLRSYLNDKFRLTLTNVGSSSVICGIAWIQVYYNEEGELKFKHIPSEEIIPFWHDSEHTELDAIIRIYEQEEYGSKVGDKKIYELIEYWTKEGVWKYKRLKVGGNLILQNTIDGEGHFKVVDSTGEEKSAVWNKVPFVAFKYNRDEVSLLNWIKPLIDDYDINTSDVSNNLQDIPNAIKIVEGYEDNDKEEFTKNLTFFRTIFVGEGGDVRSLETPTNVDEVDVHLTRLRKDIFEFGGGVDTVNKELRDVSGVALRFQYADLDMDCSEMAQQYKYSLRQLQWFINEDLKNKGEKFDDKDSNFLFNTAVILNETELINNLAVSKDMISQKTLLENHPWVKNTEQEIRQIESDKQKQMQYDIKVQEETSRVTSKYSNTNNTSNNKS